MATEADVVVQGKLSATSSPPASAAVTGGGLIITITDVIRSFLGASSTDSRLSEELRDLSSLLKLHSTVPYKSLKDIWFGSKPETRPDLSSLLRGSDFVFTSPAPRQKSEELKLRLKKLEEAAERKAYQELVKDITPRKGVEEPFSSYKDQLGLDIVIPLLICQVQVMMVGLAYSNCELTRTSFWLNDRWVGRTRGEPRLRCDYINLAAIIGQPVRMIAEPAIKADRRQLAIR